jgi:hypothetical protein
MMCQQWFSIAGLSLDITGFLLIAFEWRHMFIRERRRRLFELEHDQGRSRAEKAGNVYDDPRSAEYMMWREFQKLFFEEWTMRGRIFYSGVVLVLLGFFFQVLGSWPQGVFGVKSC